MVTMTARSVKCLNNLDDITTINKHKIKLLEYVMKVFFIVWYLVLWNTNIREADAKATKRKV